MKVVICILQHEVEIEVEHEEQIIEIKRKIEQHLGIAMSSQTLSIFGWELFDELYMKDYPMISEGTRIDLTIQGIHQHHHLILGQPNKIQILVKLSSKQHHHMEVERTEMVHSLKEKIHIIDGTPMKRMSLFFSGTELDDDYRNLSEYGVCEFSEIIVTHKAGNRLGDGGGGGELQSRKLSIVVQTSSSLLNGACIPLKLSDSSTVNDLRELLLSGKILPLDDYLFIHKQRIMRDCSSLRWHGVEDGDFLYVFKGTVSRGESSF
ncbi:hypothetical protein F8388_015459 [Cannabis sativa]|uniref:Ubiquitin-like domain-containing protein n=1 Tax=Cannabis sativa TaxID=3483 RepID=A0A7J6GID1_CANSA|nr:hypothetical protein F8388_015459 [Cannabis sativa]